MRRRGYPRRHQKERYTMACLIAPATVAIVTTVVRKVVGKKEGVRPVRQADGSTTNVSGKWTQRLGWLNLMLWGGTIVLVLDHLISGELTVSPPFLTAIETPGAVGPMFREILVTGGAMTAAVFVVWTAMIVFVELRSRARAKVAHEA
jgi:hypothetical protein